MYCTCFEIQPCLDTKSPDDSPSGARSLIGCISGRPMIARPRFGALLFTPSVTRRLPADVSQQLGQRAGSCSSLRDSLGKSLPCRTRTRPHEQTQPNIGGNSSRGEDHAVAQAVCLFLCPRTASRSHRFPFEPLWIVFLTMLPTLGPR